MPTKGSGWRLEHPSQSYRLGLSLSSSLYFFSDPLLPQAKAANWEKENWGEGDGGKEQSVGGPAATSPPALAVSH